MTFTVATFLSPNYYPLYRYVAVKLGGLLAIPEGSSFETFRARNFDLAFACGYWYAHRPEAYEPLAAPVLFEPRYRDEPVYFVDLVVRADSPVRNLAELSGQVFGFNEENSFSGYHALRAELKESFSGLFDRPVRTGSHLNSIQAILSGAADFAALDSTVLDYEFSRQPALKDQLKIITSFGPYPAPPLLVNKKLPAATRQQLREIIENLPAHELAQLGIKAYGGVESCTYAPLIKIYKENLITERQLTYQN